MTDREEDGSEGGREATDADADGAKCERRRRKTDGRTDVALSCGLVRQRRGGGGGESGKRGRVSMRGRERTAFGSVVVDGLLQRTDGDGRTGEGRPLLRPSGIIRIT